ncbi:non-ribosomal peptide synthetase [Oceanirhabdus sp. W0125-5]|uniref:non-ribosomal peptide synthetase n=1 Tax=Oceanirhabdus sp. W0125-5 TaxID=2999116 RepID=UPI0022F2CF6A|nr:non-ribosomal peptide synthetase [Oceanirhabdus sp. W0125-5]WBW95744.1 non-ribosomal peptide synthase/polyketide synthase [Oceanirhabdus sp. W0125-5]
MGSNNLRKDNVKDIMGLSDTQKGILFYYIKDEETSEYQEEISFIIQGKIDINILKKTWEDLLDNNEMLRTVFRWKKLDKPVQIVLKNYKVSIESYDISNFEDVDKKNKLSEISEKIKGERINIEEECVKFYICKLSEEKAQCFLKIHHIVYDGWSNGILIKEFIQVYNSLLNGEKVKYNKKATYKEFLNWNKNRDINKEKEYWEKYLENYENMNSTFYVNYNDHKLNSNREYVYSIDNQVKNKIKNFAKKNRVSISTVLYTAWGILQQKYDSKKDIIFGVTLSGRPHHIKNIENTVGLFINTVPLRVKAYKDEKITTVLRKLDLDLRNHEEFQYSSLVDIQSKYSTENKQLFDNLVVIENYPLDTQVDENSKINIVDYSIEEKTNYNLAVQISIFNEYNVKISYNNSFYSVFVENLVKNFEYVIIQIVDKMNINVSDIELITEEQKKQILYDFNDTKAEYPNDKTIPELFEQQVEKTPNNVAVVFGDKHLTYKELNEKSNQLAKVLREKEVRPDTIVGIMVDKSLEMIIGILGILKAGGAYLPIDHEYPRERKEYMLHDSESKILLSKTNLIDDIEFSGRIIDLLNEEIFHKDSSNLKKINKSSNLAYVIYTSGTTGKPKGVMIEHKSLINLCKNHNTKFEVSEKDRSTVYSSFSFDACVWETWPYLIKGAQIHIIDNELRFNVDKLSKYYNEKNITISFLPTQICEDFINIKTGSLRFLLTGGDKLNYFKSNEYQLVNNYGPTEATVVTTSYFVDEVVNNIPIGKPVNNSKVYIINTEHKLLPVGVTGELCIAGEVLARGYLNKPELTEQKFIKNPFENGQRMYKTGDLARWLPDGNIEFLGRKDKQVKIRGFRIELAEIESRLVQFRDIRDAIVISREKEGKDKYLCAYLVSNEIIDNTKIRDYLKESLPEYMIPSFFVNIDNIPLTINGKVDKKALPEPNINELIISKYEAPRNKVEKILVSIWCDVLEIKKVGINDNFFDIGGHSLKATTVISKIHKKLDIEVPLNVLFMKPTIKEISNYIQKSNEKKYENIKKLKEKEYYEISAAQKRIYTIQQFDNESIAYNMPVVYELAGKIDREKIQDTFRKLVNRHESLRTYFEIIEGEIVQKIDCKNELKITSNIKATVEIENYINKFIRPFNLENSPLFRVEILESNDKNFLLIDMHHIISDGVSMSILIKEFIALYNGEELEPLRIQYKDFAEWQNIFLKSEEMKKQEEYWINRFNDEIPILNMPTDYERPVIQSFEGANLKFSIDEKTTEALRNIAKECESTMHMILLSAFNILLSKYSGQDDIVIGTPIAGRAHSDLENITGMFVNTLPLRNNPNGDKSYMEFLKEVKYNSIKAYENQSYQLEELIEKLKVRRDTSRNPIFDVTFNLTNIKFERYIEVNELILKQCSIDNKVAKFDLTLTAIENEKNIEFNFEYCTKLFKEETLNRMSKHYKKILNDVCESIEIKLSEIDIITEKEKNQILYEFNNTKAEYTENKTIHELFEEQVEKTPDNPALVFEDIHLTYKELNEKANQLARVIRKKGVQPENIIGIMVERSIEMIVSILGVLKSGGAYLPIDPASPIERIEYMLRDSDCKLLLTKKQFSKSIDFQGDVLQVSNNEIYKGDTSNLARNNNCENLAYIIYTSGTTGNPKGVLIEQKNIRNTLLWRKEYYKFDSHDSILQIPSFSFDSSVEDIMTPLISGSKLVLINQEKRLDIEYLKRIIIRNNVSNFLITPAFYSTLLDECLNEVTSLRKITVAGESIHEDVVTKHFETLSNTKLYNEYGPTENSVCSTIYEFHGYSNKVLIGKPISNTKVLILDSKNKFVPIGIPGELCVSGEGVARGYLNRPELTNKKFIENQYEKGKKLYKTGDLARWLPDGNIEFLGRIDNQVKIRGFRIELGEIENRILSHQNSKEAVVLVKENEKKEKYLCAYVVVENNVESLELRKFLKDSLPDYMIPSKFVYLDKLPLTTNGKINRKALPEPNINETTAIKYEAPRNMIEEKLVKIWSEVLNVKRIGISDNFFDLGGHSLKATLLVSRIHKQLNMEVSLQELFKYPTIKEISHYLDNKKLESFESIGKVEEKEFYQVSSPQKRLYTINQFDKDSIAYNMPSLFELQGNIDKTKIENTFTKLVERHEILRTNFKSVDDEIVQRISNKIVFKLIVKKVHVDKLENIIKDFIKPFDLENGPLFRIEFVENKEKTYLLIDMHHIISDGISMSILIKEFAALYNGAKLKPLKIQYKDFSEWHNKFLKSDKMKKEEEYWTSSFSDEIPILNLPTDYERPAMKNFEGNTLNFSLDEKLKNSLKSIAKKSDSTMHMVLISAVYILLSKYSGQEDIVIGTPTSGRNHADTQNIMGMFVNTLALRNYPSGQKTFIEFLKDVKENSLKAYENQNYQYEDLIDRLIVRRDPSRNPLFDVMFNMANIDYGLETDISGLILKQELIKNNISKFDLTFTATEYDKSIDISLEYCTKLFKKETIKRIGEHYIVILNSICKDCEVKISEISILSEKEENKIFFDFNNTIKDYPDDKTLPELFEEQVKKTPDKIAVVFEENQITYKELNEKSNQLARTLRKNGIKPDNIIGIMVERSLEMITGVIGILKSGGAYLPIDPKTPKDRVGYILKDSECNILLTTNEHLTSVSFKGEVLDIRNKKIYEESKHNLEKNNNCNNLAYVIYTSGTSGNPKGVLIEHKSIINTLFWRRKYYGFDENDVTLQMPSFSFDSSVQDIMTPLITGSKLVVMNQDRILDTDYLKHIIISNKVTNFLITPAFYKTMLEECLKDTTTLTRITVGGESIHEEVVRKHFEIFSNTRLFNEYGPTENSVCTTIYEIISEKNKILIGTPIANTKVFILDSKNKMLPIGVQGELCITGDGLARGYLNRQELTDKKFIQSPFEQGRRMYKTGDLARWLPDGNIEFLGRIDNQVKIRGFRIELGEIENRLLTHEKINEAVVMLKNNNSEKYLCAYIVCEDEIENSNIIDYLKQSLPEYMVPLYYVHLDKIPLTENGKINRRVLPEPNINEAAFTEFESPRNHIEEMLVEIWSEVLGVNKISINDNFFDLGGHSLKATSVKNKIHKKLQVEVPLKEFFKRVTIKEISNFVENSTHNSYINIPKVMEKEHFKVSSAQKRLFTLYQLDKDSTAYNMPALYELDGDINKEKIENVFNKLFERHESLRTYFETINGEIVQKIDKKNEFKLDDIKENKKYIADISSKVVRPFKLDKGPLFRVSIINNNERNYLFIDMHHIISDGISMSILIKEFSALYNSKELSPLKIQYKDFAEWQNKFLQSEEMKKQEKYWMNQFNDDIPVLNMPTDYERPLIKSYEGENISLSVDEETLNALKKVVKDTGSTMNMVLISAMYILLSKYSGQEDIIIGTPIAGRAHSDTENIIGMFVNTLALRNFPSGEKSYIDFLEEVKDNSFNAYENQSYQFEELIQKLEIRRDTSRNPLFDVMFNMININNSADIELDNLKLREQEIGSKISKFDLTLTVIENKKSLEFCFEYCIKLFNEETIKRLGSQYLKILRAICRDYEVKLSEIEIITEKEKDQILFDFNDTKSDYPKDKTINEIFEEQVEKTPDNIAVMFEDKKLTYSELNKKSNQLARNLRNIGIGPESIVGIIVERSFEMIIGIIGILKAGGAYLPIDYKNPKERIEYTLNDAKVDFLVTTSKYAGMIDFKGQLIDLTDENNFEGDCSNLTTTNKSSDLAYVIYTSGSTGNPKGVLIEHRSAVNTLMFMEKNYPLKDTDVYLLKTKYTFDVSVTELFGWFVGNGTLAILKENEENNINSINNAINKYKVTHINFVPAMLSMFNEINEEDIDKIKSLKYVFSAGEELKGIIANNFFNKFNNIKLENIYGPTEDTIYASKYSIAKDVKYNSIPIGRPLQNNKIYIVNNDKLMPIGVPGEICISGDGLARGYLNRPELTLEKFVNNPFDHGERMYKTGDLARWLPDGNIEFMGRIDNQVKIRGFRIELSEIENRLLNQINVEKAIVIARVSDKKEKYLCAYVVMDKEIDSSELRNHLKESLPEYMIPAYFVQIEKIPLTANGKINKKALPEPNISKLIVSKYEAPRNEIDEKLVEIWCEVLGVDRVGINDNFFDLGGHSLNAAVLMSKIHKELFIEVPLKEIFKSPTIKELSIYIANSCESPYVAIGIVDEQEYYEASSAQKRLYTLQQFEKDSIVYNMPAVYQLLGNVDKVKIEKAFKRLVERHEALRTCFYSVDGEIVQKIDNKFEFNLLVSSVTSDEESIMKNFIRTFDINKAPLFRVEVIQNNEKTYLLIDMHHIISDGVSMSILIKEFTALYNGEELEPLRIQYKEFTEWQNKFLRSDEIKKQEEYWLDRFSDEIPVLNLPTDYERPMMQSFEGDNFGFTLHKEVSEHLRKVAKESESTMHMVLLSAVYILLAKYSGQEDIIVGTPIAGRPHADLQNIIGVFVNTLALRNAPNGEKTYTDFLKEVRENSLKAYDNQSYQFEELIEKLQIKRDTSRNPLFDVMFNMTNIDYGTDSVLDGLEIKQYITESKISKFDLTLTAVDDDNIIKLNLEYCTKLFKKETIERMASHYVEILNSICNNSDIKLSEIEILTYDEKNQIVYDFNNTKTDYPKGKTLQELFEEQVEKTPDNIAVVYEDKQLTYKELNEKSNIIARLLRNKGISSECIVGIMAERSIEMIIGMIGTLKAGGAYLPIDPNYPKDRIEYMLEDSNAVILLTQVNFESKVEAGVETILLDDDKSYIGVKDNLTLINDETNLAYVIYTSGSTGKPKGVMIEHRNVINTILWFINKYNINYQKNILNMTDFTFDPSVEQIMGALISGAKLFIPRKKDILDKKVFRKTVECNDINIINCIPRMAKEVLFNETRLNSLETIILGGDNLEPFIKNEIMAKGYNLYNHYGPTETSIDAITTKCSVEEKVLIGKPIDNTQVYITNTHGQLQPIGTQGEICISGRGIARGYLNRTDLTKEKFIENPFEPGRRMYKTGDLGRWLPDGSIEFLGRIDNQVKIRGFRIELGEIEIKLLKHKKINEAVVLAKDDKNNEKYLCAYVVSEEGINNSTLRDYLKVNLPDYMVPSYFVYLEKMPLTSNGKINRNALPEPNLNQISTATYEAPRNEIEEKLVEIWCEVLGLEKIGINNNFFDIGGHSLKATVLMSKIHKELNVELQLKELFKSPTIKEISKYIENSSENLYKTIEKAEEKDYYETSSAQKRLYTLQMFEKESTAYNMPVVYELDGEIDKERIENTFKKLVERHDALKTYFQAREGEIIQKIDSEYEFKMLFRKTDEKESINLVTNFIRAFNLENAPLFRAEIIESKEKNYLLIDMHHIISDGVSMSILINEFIILYNGVELEPLRIQYKDFAEWQNKFLKSDEIKKQEDYWINRFNDEIPVLNMPYDYERPKMQSFEGDNVSFKIDEKISNELRIIAKESGSTMHMILLSVFNILLSKYSGQEDIIVGVPIAGRSHADLQRVMGMFVNTLPMRNKPSREKTYVEFLREVKENSIKAYENQSYQFEELIQKLQVRRDTSRNPLFDVMFNMINIDYDTNSELKGLRLKPLNTERKVSKVDMILRAVDNKKTLELNLEYCTKLFKEETINRAIRDIKLIIETISKNSDIEIDKINILSNEEEDYIIEVEEKLSDLRSVGFDF